MYDVPLPLIGKNRWHRGVEAPIIIAMHRDKFTAKLLRIVESIESSKLPIDVRELYVFGSYSRGAIEPGDLDLIIVHGPGRQEIDKQVEKALQKSHPDILDRVQVAAQKQNAARMRLFRKPGEAVQIIFVESIAEVTGKGSRIKPTDPILIWSNHDRRWREKLASIVPDAHAGRAERNHLVELKRLNDRVSVMERVVEMVDQEMLTLTRIPIDTITLKLGPYHRRFLEHWTVNCKVMGRKSLETLAYVMWWFEQNRDQCMVPDRTEVWNLKFTLRCEVGKPSLGWMLGRFAAHPKLKRQCLIPHFKRNDPNELLVFERGPRWDERDSTKRDKSDSDVSDFD
ncbi:MAG: hypothetical protein QM811_13420 [Pirellulales bacterium]